VEELSMDGDGQPSPRFLTVAEVAYLTRLSKATVYRLVRAGRIPAVRFGRSYRVTEAAVDEYIENAALSDEARDIGFG
jgi:excisionase family DNA binding protein